MSKKVKNPIRLSEMKICGIMDAINLLLEYFVFFRWIFFKNRPRGNLFLVRALLIVAVFAMGYFFFFGQIDLVLEGIEVDPVLLLAAGVVFGYWNMLGVFHKKSAYCLDLYNAYLKEIGAKEFEKAKLLSISISINLLTLDLWGHRGFSKLFCQTLEDALNLQGNSDAFEKLNKGKMTIREAREILETYQSQVIAELKAA